jgi:small basic protein (TIGR04137 family)
MSIDRSLKIGSSLARHRNVLTRAERIARLAEKDAWSEGKSVFGLPKVANRSTKMGKKTKKKEEAAAGKEGEVAAAPATAAPAKK